MSTPVAQLTSPAPTTIVREARPFAWLQPANALSSTAFRGLRTLRIETEEHRLSIVRSVVDASFRFGRRLDLVGRRSHPAGVVNRRRRAATFWVNAVLEAQCDPRTLQTLVRTWLPQLAGTGPDVTQATRVGRELLEYLRGLATALLFDTSAANLVPQARALHALESVLAVHLQAIEQAGEHAA